jgi:hypothetical protein
MNEIKTLIVEDESLLHLTQPLLHKVQIPFNLENWKRVVYGSSLLSSTNLR